MYEKIDQALEQRDDASLAKKKLEQKITRYEDQINRLTQKVGKMEEITKEKDNMIKKVNDENKKLAYRMEHLDSEREGTIDKIETILNE